MNAMGVIFALLTTLSWSIGIFPFTTAARRLGVEPLNHFRLALATVILSFIAILTTREGLSGLFEMNMLHAWMWLGLSGVIGLTIGDHFGFAGFVILGPRLGSVLSTFAPGATLLLGYFLTNDRLNWIGITGMLTTMFGVIVLSLSREERNLHEPSAHGSLLKGVIYGILAAFCQGAGLVMAKKGMEITSASKSLLPPFQATFIRLSSATFSIYLISAMTGKLRKILRPVVDNKQGGIKPAIIGTIFGPVTGVSLSLFTVSLLNPSVAQTIFSLVPVVALLIAMLFYREPVRPKAMAGVIVAITGVVLLVWRESIERFIHQL